MAAWMACCPGRWIIHSGFCLAAMAMLAVMASEGVAAQTLTAPNPPPKSLAPPVAAKSPSTEPMKSCSAYGAGFVQIPGSDACVKIGGFVTMEGTAH
jgi:Porin subfamily